MTLCFPQALGALERTPADFHAVSAASLVAEYGRAHGLQLSTQALQVCTAMQSNQHV
jgi:hypothetical protein